MPRRLPFRTAVLLATCAFTAAAAPAKPPSPWPLRTVHDTPAGAHFDFPPGARVLDVDVSPDGTDALAVIERTDKTTEVLRWDFARPPEPVKGIAAPDGAIRELARSPFDDTVYLVEAGSFGTRIVPAKRGASGDLARRSPIYSSRGEVSHLRLAFLLYDDAVRLFFADTLARNKAPRIMSITSRGDRRYELTSPSGSLTEATAAELRTPRPKDEFIPPNVAKAAGAWPISIHPRSGSLSWTDLQGRTFVSDYNNDYEVRNWVAPRAVEAPKGSRLSFSPNGAYSMLFAPGEKGATVQVTGRPKARVCEDVGFAINPAIAPSGKALVGFVEKDGHHQLVTCAVDVPLADVFFLDDTVNDSALRDRLASRGLSVRDSKHDYIWSPYDEIGYSDMCGDTDHSAPLYATIDGFIEVLAAGTRAALAEAERAVSRDRLKRVTEELERAAAARKLPRIVGIARQTAKILAGDYGGAEGRLVRAEKRATSQWHGKDIDFGVTKPLGIYASRAQSLGAKSEAPDEALANYYRAATYLNLTSLTDAEGQALAGDAQLSKALDAWREVGRRFASPWSRQVSALGPQAKPPPFLVDACIPDRVKGAARLMPLAWGIDSEILESTVVRKGATDRCSVPDRWVPQGLDLLVGLGSKEARSLMAHEEQTFPALARVHDDLARRFAGPVPADSFYDDWLRLVQLLATEERVPSGVSAARWKARLLETSLASWVSLRHTTVLFNEVGAAECGDVVQGFEELKIEPLRGVVDPLPEAWRQLAEILGRLDAETRPSSGPLADVLGRQQNAARDFASMAERQMRGEPLTEEEYADIQHYGGAIEHPIVELEGSVGGIQPSYAGLGRPTPLAKIVPILQAGEGGPFWQPALGRPRSVTAVLHDRGQRVVAIGAWSSYYEHLGPRADDDEWRRMLDKAQRPAWVTVDE